jgi:cystathionine beta-lyase/cystathionine gamma-synthase
MKGKKELSKAIGDLPGVSLEKGWTDELDRGRRPGPRMAHHKASPTALGFSTRAVHAGTYEDPVVGAIGTPIFQSSTFLFSQHTYEAFFQGTTRDVPIYTRYGNPSQWAVQEKISNLEGAESSVVFSSGMAAISTTLLALTNRGGHIVSAHDIYGGTYNFLHHDMVQLGRSVSFVEATDFDQIVSAVTKDTQILFFETLTNPLLKAIPLASLNKFCKDNEILLVVDNTLLSPYCCRPLVHGADVVLHSCTKYMNGHSDLTAGVASGSRKYMDRVWDQMLRFGGQLEPLSCFLLERGLKTLALRVERPSSNAEAIASFLSGHPRVYRVYHPSLPDYPYPWLKQYTDNGYGGMVSFEVGSDEEGLHILNALTIPAAATSLGGIESLVSMPFNTSHSALTQRQRCNAGINPGLIRLSVGIEDINDLLTDLKCALDSLG